MYLIFRTFESQKNIYLGTENERKKENEKNIDGFCFCYIVRTNSITEWIFCRSSSTWPIKWRSINWTLLWKWFFVGQRSPLKSLSNLSIENYEYILMALNKSFFSSFKFVILFFYFFFALRLVFFLFLCIWVMVFLYKICSADDEARTIVKHTTAYAFVCTFDELIYSIGVCICMSAMICAHVYWTVVQHRRFYRNQSKMIIYINLLRSVKRIMF